MKYKIAIGGIHIESSTFTSYISTSSDFQITRDTYLLDRYNWLSDFDVEVVPLIHARALPGGIVDRMFFDEWLSEFETILEQNNDIDGLLFDIHGAMVVEGIEDAEGFVLDKVRKIVGEDTIISTTMDLHGNVSDLLFDNSDLITCYRTAPHTDQDKTRYRAFSNLVKVLDNKLEVFNVKVDIPILLPGEKTSTEVEPGKGLYEKLEEVCNHCTILDASIWMGFPWADEKRNHSSIVVSGINKNLVTRKAKELADLYWNKRKEFRFVGPVVSPVNAVKESLSSKIKPFFISDTGDNPGAGGANDVNTLLSLFIQEINTNKMGKNVLFASIYDSESIERIYRKKDEKDITIQLGGKIDKRYGEPIELNVKVVSLFTLQSAGKCALVSYKSINILITANRFQYGTLDAFNQSNIQSLDDFDIVVVKMGYLEPELKQISKGWVMALTDGAVSQEMNADKYKYLKRPLYPFDEIDDGVVFKTRMRTSKSTLI